jgi:hypothetical protein
MGHKSVNPRIFFLENWQSAESWYRWNNILLVYSGDTKQSRLESTTEIAQNKHVKVLHYFVDDIKLLKCYL